MRTECIYIDALIIADSIAYKVCAVSKILVVFVHFLEYLVCLTDRIGTSGAIGIIDDHFFRLTKTI
jgi:hypothetical protein